ncbi:MAG: type IV toxin-antitoxin system AbiEi family antitoxin domain-containing protein [Candidatus Omnitrophica bacterium]|nr:type IV toxin-antitoxin system AbiEi family antitoxin domain-containing protein [Candidatus Omnitrophota bacterium]
MANYVNWITVGRALRAQGLRVFTPLELRRLLRISPVAVRFLVHRAAKRGLLTKLRRGLYAVTDAPPSAPVVANRLYEPSYLSFEWALAYHHLIPEMTYVLTSATSRPTRTFSALGHTFEYHRLKVAAFTGYAPVKVGTDTVLVAMPEKALVDTVYFVDLQKKALGDRLDLRSVNWRRAESYARRFGRPSLMVRLRALR